VNDFGLSIIGPASEQLSLEDRSGSGRLCGLFPQPLVHKSLLLLDLALVAIKAVLSPLGFE
jgi:hypothetical protein